MHLSKPTKLYATKSELCCKPWTLANYNISILAYQFFYVVFQWLNHVQLFATP